MENAEIDTTSTLIYLLLVKMGFQTSRETIKYKYGF